MSKSESVKIGKVSVLAFEKKLVPSDAYMSGTRWSERFDRSSPLVLVEKSVRGTISNRLNKALQSDHSKLNSKVESPNLQTVDFCALQQDQDTLKLSFTLKVLGGLASPSACNNSDFRKSYASVVKAYIAKTGFSVLAARYAANLANGRFLWRNRVGAEEIEIHITVLNGTHKPSWIFNASSMSLRDFEQNSQPTEELASLIAQALSSESDFLLLEVTAFAKVGQSQDVYPSEELILNKNSGKSTKSKTLYSVKGQAAMHSQKVGNALRSIDTWYPDYADLDIGPIAVEVYGAVTSLGTAYRSPTSKSDFYSLFDSYARGGVLSNDDENYVVAMLVRGGVFGESDKE